MFKFIAISISKGQIKEAILYRHSLYIKLFNEIILEIMEEKENHLENIFLYIF